MITVNQLPSVFTDKQFEMICTLIIMVVGVACYTFLKWKDKL